MDKGSVSFAYGNCADLIKANAGDVGYYRTEYAPALLAQLRENVSSLHPADQLNLLNDTWALVTAGRTTTADYLSLAQLLAGSQKRTIVAQVCGVIGFIDGLEEGRPGRAPFRGLARQWLAPQMERLGWKPRPGESTDDALLRVQIITTLGDIGDDAVIAQARALYAKYLEKPRSLAVDLRAPVLTLVGRYADRTTYDRLHQLALKAPGTEERQLYYRSMAGALDPELATLTLAISLTDETVPQETVNLVPQVAQSAEQQELAWAFAKRHIKELLAELESFRVNGYVPGIMSAFTDNAHADELESFVKDNVGEGGLAKARETAEGIRFNAEFKERELPGIDEWVLAHGGGVRTAK